MTGKKLLPKNAMTFQQCVQTASHHEVVGGYRAGLTALGNNSAKVVCVTPRNLTGSLDLDAALAANPNYAQSNRWDYGVGYKASRNAKEIAIWIEVHSAQTSEVSVVIKKKNWAKDYLVQHCTNLWLLTTGAGRAYESFYWVASNGVHISKNSPQARALASAGIPWPQNVLRLV